MIALLDAATITASTIAGLLQDEKSSTRECERGTTRGTNDRRAYERRTGTSALFDLTVKAPYSPLGLGAAACLVCN